MDVRARQPGDEEIRELGDLRASTSDAISPQNDLLRLVGHEDKHLMLGAASVAFFRKRDGGRTQSRHGFHHACRADR